VKPAPPVDPELPTEEEMQMPMFNEEEDDGKAKVIVPDHMKDDVGCITPVTKPQKLTFLHRSKSRWKRLTTMTMLWNMMNSDAHHDL
jgi:hypothetical protein